MPITNVSIADNGHLMVVDDEGTVFDAGNVRGIPGPQGERGVGVKGDRGDMGPTGPSGLGLPGYRGVCVDDGVPVQLDNIVVQMNTAAPRSLQFKVATGTLSVNISGEIYWSNGNFAGNYQASYWTGNTLNTTFQQIFGWSFPWAGDKAVYNVQDLTNKRFYRITLIIGASYKSNYIIMERLV